MTTAEAHASPFTVGHRTVTRVAGPLIIVDGMDGVGYGELVEVETGDGPVREGQVLELDGSLAVVQVFGGTVGIGRRETAVLTRGRAARTGVGADYFGRVLDGGGRPRDRGPQPVPDDYRHVNGLPLNPITRTHPDQFIETGVSAIDGLVTLVRGQKLPIFSGAGLPANGLAARIAAQARVPGDDAEVVVIFAAMGVTRREAEFFRAEFLTGGAAARSVLLLNLADDPTIERLLTPRVALTMAEYLAFEQHRHVLVVMTDMTAYCEALREISAAREEMPGRRGYPGYMYTDLASLYERAGRVRGGTGSLTQLMILTMPDDDITHPIPDLTGYITEGQIVLSRDLDRQGIEPPIDVLPSLSRLMNAGIGAGKTRDDHRGLADQLYACYARGREVRRLMSIVGESGLPPEDRRYLAFAAAFETIYLDQGPERRILTDTLELGWQLLSPFPAGELKRVSAEQLALYHHEATETMAGA
ncbi:V/A-type H+-transporting ATPase subunit B [Kribbella orskensis]|uniref:V-type ATP synthase beta chain n=1 Tax=Kribbella orskensis TaxID=2512216 RepID=A0ABY2BC59_9ACTN|nr:MULTISPECIES: V-type ATP synthase subunit B [Kribbella]TCN32901.1 V/A-type H+-transporting ATPase subunit B [Kribbella sp. VKM Ac-2500]TCO13225.1 V/A-type H+-transporting ATPase subunit B [Kribbella orskensis]